MRERIPEVEKETLNYVKPIIECANCMREAGDEKCVERDNCVQKIKKHHLIVDTNGSGGSSKTIDMYLKKRYCKKLCNAMGEEVECP